MTSNDVMEIRKGLGLSRKEFARLLSVPYETLCRWENGNRTPSKVYESKLRELTSKTHILKKEENWIFLDFNIQRIINDLAKSWGLVFGTVHVFTDPSETFFLARIRVRPEAHSIHDLSQYVHIAKNLEGSRHMVVVGCFVGGLNESSEIHRLALQVRELGLAYCVVYNRVKKDISVWKFRHPIDLTENNMSQLRSHIVGR